jgi:hypothetical protein
MREWRTAWAVSTLGPQVGAPDLKATWFPMIFRWVGEGPTESRGIAEKSQSRMRPFAKAAGSIIVAESSGMRGARDQKSV